MIDYEKLKFKLGQEVYFMHTSLGWMQGDVTSVNKHLEYIVNGIHPLTEDCMYATSEALIKAQIEHWSSMLKEDEPKKSILECKWCGSHESCKHGSVFIGTSGATIGSMTAVCGGEVTSSFFNSTFFSGGLFLTTFFLTCFFLVGILPLNSV